MNHSTSRRASACWTDGDRIADSLDVDDAPRGLWALGRAIGAPVSLAQVGFDRADIGDVARVVSAATFPNPAAVTQASVGALLEAASAGEPPSFDKTRGHHDEDAFPDLGD